MISDILDSSAFKILVILLVLVGVGFLLYQIYDDLQMSSNKIEELENVVSQQNEFMKNLLEQTSENEARLNESDAQQMNSEIHDHLFDDYPTHDYPEDSEGDGSDDSLPDTELDYQEDLDEQEDLPLQTKITELETIPEESEEESEDDEVIDLPLKQGCTKELKSGKNKGQPCNKKTLKNSEFCKMHSK